MKTTNNKAILIIMCVTLAALIAVFCIQLASNHKNTTLGSVSAVSLPNPILTPGATNPDITQANISQNICNPGWSTKSIRPASAYTTKLKIQQIKQYGYSDTNLADYEEDHLISLELGGSPTDPKNLWPEAYQPIPGAHEKDKVENYLHSQVCSGKILLKDAQNMIATNWYAVYLKIIQK